MELAHGREVRRPGNRTGRVVAGAVALVAILAALGAALLSGGGSDDGGRQARADRSLPNFAIAPVAPVIPRAGTRVRYVAPGGSDGGPGSRRQPWRTLRRAIEGSRPGVTIVLRRGVYGSRGEFINVDRAGTSAAPITIVGERRPKVLGAFVVRADNVRVRGIVFAGPTGRVYDRRDELGGESDQVTIDGDRVEIADCEIRDNRGHAGIFVYRSENVRLVGNYIHRNGNFDKPSEANLDHGIYFGAGSGVVANNIIENNYAFGLQLYPGPHDVLVTHNTIVRNGRSGVIVADSTTNSVIVNNIIAYNGQNAVRGFELSRRNNVVENNLFWGNAQGDVASSSSVGLSLRGNRSADPRFRDRFDYRLRRGSPALGQGARKGKIRIDYRGRSRPRRGRVDLGALEAR